MRASLCTHINMHLRARVRLCAFALACIFKYERVNKYMYIYIYIYAHSGRRFARSTTQQAMANKDNFREARAVRKTLPQRPLMKCWCACHAAKAGLNHSDHFSNKRAITSSDDRHEARAISERSNPKDHESHNGHAWHAVKVGLLHICAYIYIYIYACAFSCKNARFSSDVVSFSFETLSAALTLDSAFTAMPWPFFEQNSKVKMRVQRASLS